MGAALAVWRVLVDIAAFWRKVRIDDAFPLHLSVF